MGILGSVYPPGKYVLKVCFDSPFTRMISVHSYTREIPEPAPFLSWHGAQIGGIQVFLVRSK